MASLLNISRVKQYSLEVARQDRNGRFTRVGKDFVDRIEANLKVMIRGEINRLPSVGKTIQ